MKKNKKYTAEELNAMKPSDLLRVAIRDIKNYKKREDGRGFFITIGRRKYNLSMGTWISRQDRTCYACMAGICLIRNTGEDGDYPCVHNFMSNINNMRLGVVGFIDDPPELPTNWRETYLQHTNAPTDEPYGMLPIEMYEKMAQELEDAGY